MNDLDKIPAFISPLTEKQHTRLGRISVLWGQVDFLVDELMLDVLGLTIAQRDLLIGDKPIGAKIDMMNRAVSTWKNRKAREKTVSFFALVDDVKTQRNHVIHGVWGWRPFSRGRVQVCVRHKQNVANPVTAGGLPRLEKQLCAASAAGMEALIEARDWKPRTTIKRFSHFENDQPEWYAKWLEQHPLRDDNLDRSWSEGQLPRLIDPLS